MKRWIWFSLCAFVGLAMFVAGLLVPAHLRAVDREIIERAGRKSRSLVQEGMASLEQRQLGVAEELLTVARGQNLPGSAELGLALGNSAMSNPGLAIWGGASPGFEPLLQDMAGVVTTGRVPVVRLLLRQEHRTALLASLQSSPDPVLKTLLACRGLTNTVLFPSSASSAGQALDTALVLAGLLVREDRLAPGLREALAAQARQAVAGADPQRLEQMLVDLLSLSQRFNWGQLTIFLARIEDAETLRHLAWLARRQEPQLPVLFSAVYLSGRPAAVVAYLMEFSQNGLADLGEAVCYGVGGVRELIQRKMRLHEASAVSWLARHSPLSGFRQAVLDYCWLLPWLGLAFKWLLYLGGGFCLAAAMHFARPAATALERPLYVPGFHLARELLFALGFLLVVLLLSEPFLSQESQRMDLPFRLRLPMVGAAVAAGTPPTHSSIMNQLSLLTLLLFFVLQALIYTACLVKLAEIRRQQVPPRMKLKLLENEDHLFDAGLYLGFVGTIISLILVSLGVIKPSLMAAYSSTSFGIIFVSILKIFHVRPYRRKLILQAEGVPS